MVCGRGRVRDQGLGVPQVVRDINDLKSVHHFEGLVLAADQLEGHHGPTAIHLLLGKVVLRVRLEPWIDHPQDL